jgi:hypothetical protein
MVVTALRRRRRDVQHHSGGQQSRVTCDDSRAGARVDAGLVV